MVTGVTASALVSICIEGASNYRENCRRYIILSDYLSAIFHYELEMLSSFCLEIDQSMGRLLILTKHDPGWGIYARIIEKTPTPLS